MRTASVRWQTLFALIFPVNIYAAYRIGKMRRFLLYVIFGSIGAQYGVSLVPAGLFLLLFVSGITDEADWEDWHDATTFAVNIFPTESDAESYAKLYEAARDDNVFVIFWQINAGMFTESLEPQNWMITPNTIVTAFFVAFSVFLIRRWTRQFNACNA